jgi:hypothetical protein
MNWIPRDIPLVIGVDVWLIQFSYRRRSGENARPESKTLVFPDANYFVAKLIRERNDDRGAVLVRESCDSCYQPSYDLGMPEGCGKKCPFTHETARFVVGSTTGRKPD